MRNLPVLWREGMFLRPQHFQAADRHWAEILRIARHFDHAYGYGLRHIHISSEAINNHQFDVSSLHARMKDGTIVHLDDGQQPDRLDLKEALAEEAVVRVFLAVPKLRLGQTNVGNGVDKTRFHEVVLEVPEETVGSDQQEIALRHLSVRFILSTEDGAGYELLPVAQICRGTDQGVAPTLDEEYVPPLLAIDCWSQLGRDIVRAIYDEIGKRIHVLGEQVRNRGMTLASDEPGDLDRVLMLRTLNEAYGSLGRLTFAEGVHPFEAYGELCRIVGMLSIFGEERTIPDIPAYDHDDLARIFRWLKDLILKLIYSVQDFQYEQRYFVGAGPGLQVSLEPRWFAPEWTWYVGVSASQCTPQECQELLSPGKLHWKMGSARQVDQLFKYQRPGVTLKPLAQAPRALPITGNWIYYAVSKADDTGVWADVMDESTLAIRLAAGNVSNLDTLQGERKLHVTHGAKTVILQFAIFVVPIVQ